VRSSPVRASRSRRALRGGVAGLAIVLALAGCTRPGTVAAVVDGTTISVSDLHRAVTELGAVYTGATLPAVLTAMLVEPTFVDVASSAGAGVSVTQASDSLKQAYLAKQLTPPTSFGSGAIAVERFELAVAALGKTAAGTTALTDAEARVQKLHVEVNPRFGTLDFSTATIKPLAYAWIVSASPAAP
jgi:hypothetical protein